MGKDPFYYLKTKESLISAIQNNFSNSVEGPLNRILSFSDINICIILHLIYLHCFTTFSLSF